MLGIVPGWGGMLRLPQRVGPQAALDMMLTGKTIDAKRPRRLGLADDCVPPRVMDNAAAMLVLSDQPRRRPPLLQRLLNGPLKALVASGRESRSPARAREHYPAPYAIIDIWAKPPGQCAGRAGTDRQHRSLADGAQSGARVLPAGAPEELRQGEYLPGQTRARRRRRRDGRRHRRLVRPARADRHPAGSGDGAHRAGLQRAYAAWGKRIKDRASCATSWTG
jgi:hypothetical protein